MRNILNFGLRISSCSALMPEASVSSARSGSWIRYAIYQQFIQRCFFSFKKPFFLTCTTSSVLSMGGGSNTPLTACNSSSGGRSSSRDTWPEMQGKILRDKVRLKRHKNFVMIRPLEKSLNLHATEDQTFFEFFVHLLVAAITRISSAKVNRHYISLLFRKKLKHFSDTFSSAAINYTPEQLEGDRKCTKKVSFYFIPSFCTKYFCFGKIN